MEVTRNACSLGGITASPVTRGSGSHCPMYSRRSPGGLELVDAQAADVVTRKALGDRISHSRPAAADKGLLARYPHCPLRPQHAVCNGKQQCSILLKGFRPILRLQLSRDFQSPASHLFSDASAPFTLVRIAAALPSVRAPG